MTKVYNDDKLGITIEISHGDGLCDSLLQPVNGQDGRGRRCCGSGDVISGVGITALFEQRSSSPALRSSEDGIPIDPAEFIALQ